MLNIVQTIINSNIIGSGQWFKFPFGDIYIRKKNCYINGRAYPFIVFANLLFHQTGQGILTAILNELEIKQFNLYFESVGNPRLAKYLVRNSYSVDENDLSFSSFYKLNIFL